MLVKCETKKSLKGIAFCRLGTHIGDTLCHLCVTPFQVFDDFFFSSPWQPIGQSYRRLSDTEEPVEVEGERQGC